MSVQHLGVDRPIAVPAGQVEVELVDLGNTGASVDVVDAVTRVSLTSVPLSPTRVVFAAPGAPATVIARGPGGGAFPSGASVQVMLRVGHQPMHAELEGPRTDVGALHEPILLSLVPEGSTIQVTAVKVDEAATPPPDEQPLPELARRAFYLARGNAQIAGPGAGRRGVVVCIDASASMRAHAAVLQCLLEIAFGIDRGMGDARDVPAFAVTSQVRPLPALTPSNLTGYAARMLGHPAGAASTVPPLESGCRAELLLRALGDARRDRSVLLLTDEIPSGIDTCARQWSDDVAGWRVAVIGSAEDLLAARGVGGFGLTAVAPTLDYAALCDDVSGQALLAGIVAGMTAPAGGML